MVGENIIDYLFKQAVSTLGSKWNINVGVEDIEVDPQLLFRCFITISKSTVEVIEKLFQYELRAGSSIFIWLFRLYERVRLTLHYLEHVWMRATFPKMCTFFLDGGSLLQWITWVQESSFGTLCERYCIFVRPNYLKPNIIFMDAT